MADSEASNFQDVLSQVGAGVTNPLGNFADFNKSMGLGIQVPTTQEELTNSISGLQESFTPTGAVGLNYHVLFGALRRKDPLMNYSWFCNPPIIDGISLPWYYVEEFVAPFRSFEVQTRYQEGRMCHYAGQQSISNLSLKLYDDSTGRVGAYLEAWRGAICSPNGIYSYPSRYKKNIELVVLDVSRFIQVYKIIYKGCWLTTTDSYSMGSASSDRIIAGAEFSVDTVEITVRSFSASSLSNVILSSLNNFPLGLINQLVGVDQVSSSANGLFTTGNNAVSGYGRDVPKY